LTQNLHQEENAKLLDAILLHVPFDGWSQVSFAAACQDCDIDVSIASIQCPRGALDLAVMFHQAGDQAMQRQLDDMDLSGLKFREKVTAAVRARIEVIADKEAVRRGSTLFSLPQNAIEGAGLIWGTSDAIWTHLGDTSADVNWYTKRASLSAVYGACILYWLGDDSPDHAATWDFLDRRIENVMQFEKAKAEINKNAVFKQLLAGPLWLASKIKAPATKPGMTLPGQWRN
jgi:ubiquinone biosynthesis protein COQ9